VTENLQATGNVYLAGSKPSTHESAPSVPEDFEPNMKLEEKSDGWWFEMSVDPDWRSQQRRDIVTTELLGKAKIPDAPFEQPDGTSYRLDTDYFGETRCVDNPAPGPFRSTGEKRIRLKVWPKK
jgi:alpha-N-arabinofuranosidase